MHCALINPGRAGLCLAIWLFGALGSPALGKGLTSEYSILRNLHAYAKSTYRIRVPDVAASSHRIPTVLILHDAGRNGANIVGNKNLIKAFVDRGYAVVALNALPRKNARINYRGNVPSSSEVERSFTLPFTYSKRKFLMTDVDGTIRRLKYGKDSGWYFYNVDRVRYSQGTSSQSQPVFKHLGRDEIQSLRNVLRNAEEEFGIDPKPVMVIGLGHGGSLVWQIACYAPSFGRILAPVGGAFWRKIPKNCKPGAHLVHTHHRASKFWPLKGDRGGKYEYARTSVYRNIEMLRGVNRCGPEKTITRKGELGMSKTTWADCTGGSSVELISMDDKFAFRTWWLEDMLSRLESFGIEQPSEAREEPAETDPEFKAPGTGTGFKTPGTGTGFKTPGTGTGSRFKRAK